MADDMEDGEQLSLIAPLPVPPEKKTKRPAAHEPAEVDPIAEVVLDLPLAHLDHSFDYLVPAKFSDDAQPGVRISARFGPKDVDGFIVARRERSQYQGELVSLRRVISPEPVLPAHILKLARSVADYYGGTLADVLRLAVPPRHARVEKETAAALAAQVATITESAEAEAASPHDFSEPRGHADNSIAVANDEAKSDRPAAKLAEPILADWADYVGGAALLRRLREGDSPRAIWQALPNGESGSVAWPRALAAAARETLAGGRGSLLIVPDARDVERLIAACEEVGVEPVRLTADQGPSVRYASFLAALRGQARVVVGTRAAVFAPVQNLGLVAIWDDGDENLSERLAPYPHPRVVARLRAEQENAAVVIGGYSRTVASQQWLEEGWARAVVAPRDVVRARAPRVRTLRTTDQRQAGAVAPARIPNEVITAGRRALQDGPLLVQVPRAGYVPRVACALCREPARCAECHGPLSLDDAESVPRCNWCGRLGGWQCPECDSTQLRSVVVGSSRTAEELGRAFPSVPITLSGGRAPSVIDEVDAKPRIVVATPGAEPVAAGGYAAAVVLDAGMASIGSELRAGEEALRRWLTVGALVRPGPSGTVLLVGDGPPVPTEAFVRWDPAGFAQRELADRAELSLPPAVTTATLTGEHAVVMAALQRFVAPDGVEVLGPVPSQYNDDEVRAILRGARADDFVARETLARAIAHLQATRSTRKMSGLLRIQLDPPELV